MKNRTKDILIAICIILAYLFSGIIEVIPFILLGINTANLNKLFIMIYSITYEVLFIFMIILAYKDEIKNNFKVLIKNVNDVFFKYIPYWVLMVFMMYAANALIFVFVKDIAKNEEQVRTIIDNYPIYAFILSVILAPIMEELIFRKCVRKIFSNRIIYIIVSGLFFGMMHVLTDISNVTDLLFLIPYSIPGFIFAYIYTDSKNIFSSICIHMMHNCILVMLQILI